MTMLDEEARLKSLLGVIFIEIETNAKWWVDSVSHNIYKDVVYKLVNTKGQTRELIEGSEEYYKKFRRS